MLFIDEFKYNFKSESFITNTTISCHCLFFSTKP